MVLTNSVEKTHVIVLNVTNFQTAELVFKSHFSWKTTTLGDIF